jgi:hypothetical protein
VFSDAGEQVGEVVLRIETVELGAFDQRVDRRGAAAAGIGAGKQVILAANGDAAQRALGGIVVERQSAVVEATHQRGPARPHVAEGLRELGFARELAHSTVGPCGAVGHSIGLYRSVLEGLGVDPFAGLPGHDAPRQ